MALRTLGTNGTASLSAFVVGFNDTIAADLASISTAIHGDPPGWKDGSGGGIATSGLVTGQGTNRPLLNQAYVKNGLLIVPNRGSLQLRNGDFVCWDSTTGWPIVISGDAAANGPYAHS
jgi:hypothetical protein